METGFPHFPVPLRRVRYGVSWQSASISHIGFWISQTLQWTVPYAPVPPYARFSIMRNINPWLALLCAFSGRAGRREYHGALHIGLGIPAIPAGILDSNGSVVGQSEDSW